MLDPRSEEDRRHTAFTRSFPIKTIRPGIILQGTYSYDCWGKKQGGLFKQQVTAEYSKKITGQKGSPSLELMKMGCCPPQLMKQFVEQEGAPFGEADAAEEAMKLHKRGYLGGGG